MLYESAVKQARLISSTSLAQPLCPDRWASTLDQRRAQWLEMLGLWPLPERTNMEATVTGTLDRGDYVVEKLHFQPVPGAHVAGNLYRPAQITEPLPAVLYLCGHSEGKIRATYQAHPRWFGQHGYVALVLDTIELGECQGDHHGTYHKGRWDWHSRGYCPAGMEVWAGMRALDYLEARDDVDENRMGVTGLSGGGAISWFLGAADDRLKVVAPVCQTGTIEHIVTDRATDGHCDCAFWLNYQRWCTPDLGALIAPRALLVSAGTEDILWRPYGFRDALHRIRHQYAALHLEDRVDLVEDLTPHGYTPKLNRAIFSWFSRFLKSDIAPVVDDVTDYVEPAENLLAFGGSLPAEDTMHRVEELLVRQAEVPEVTDADRYSDLQAEKLTQLWATTLRHMPDLAAPRLAEYRADGCEGHVTGRTDGTYSFATEDDVPVRIKLSMPPCGAARGLVVFALPEDCASGFMGASRCRPAVPGSVGTAGVEVRNTAATSVGPGYLWTLRRTYPLLGQTLPERQVCDLVEAMAVLREQLPGLPITLYGEGPTAVLALYAALVDELVSEVILSNIPETHRSPQTPEFLGILRVGDLPQNLGLLYPRPLTFIGELPAAYEWTRDLYEKLGHGEQVRVIEKMADWTPAG
ncbi:MAG: alpha/beta hydrolase [Bacteroidota bacterium]